jgi:predicted Zn-dependent protease
VAGVLAHEIAHVAQRHAASQLTKAVITRWTIGLLGGLLGNTGGAGTAQIAASLMANGAFLKFSRDDERDADRVGLQILTRAGWDGRGMTELFDILRRQGSRDPGAVAVFLSTHPSPDERMRALRSEVARRRGGRRDSTRFLAIKQRLSRLPPAPAMPRP